MVIVNVIQFSSKRSYMSQSLKGGSIQLKKKYISPFFPSLVIGSTFKEAFKIFILPFPFLPLPHALVYKELYNSQQSPHYTTTTTYHKSLRDDSWLWQLPLYSESSGERMITFCQDNHYFVHQVIHERQHQRNELCNSFALGDYKCSVSTPYHLLPENNKIWILNR